MSTLAQAINDKATNQKFDSVFECPRCDGKGYLPEFRHINNGTCFLCAGAKVINCKTVANFGKGRKPQVVFTTDNQSIEVWFDSKIGMTSVYGNYIKDENRQEMRDLWKWFKANGATMLTATYDHDEYRYIYKEA